VKIGLQIPISPRRTDRHARADLATVARTATTGVSSSSRSWITSSRSARRAPEHEMLEPTPRWVTSRLTSRAKLVTLVTGAIYRNPGILAKIVTTLDVLSGGGPGSASRGVERGGVPWPGIPFPPVAERSSGSRKRCRSACRCGAATKAVPRPALLARPAAELAAVADQADPRS